MRLTLNHQTQLFRVQVNGRTIGRFEDIHRQEPGINGTWHVLTGPQGVRYVLERREA